jgi:hypothetical protein
MRASLSVKASRRVLWGLVLSVIVLNAILFLVFWEGDSRVPEPASSPLGHGSEATRPNG